MYSGGITNKTAPSFIFFPPLHLSVSFTAFTSQIISCCNRFKCEENAYVRGALCCFLMKLLCFLGEEAAVMGGDVGGKLKVTPRLKCLGLLL